MSRASRAAARKRLREEFKVGKPHSYSHRSQRGIHAPMTDAEFRASWAAQPPDDRTPQQRLMGEPPRHRSALYQRGPIE